MIGLSMQDPMEPIRVIWKVKDRWEKQKDVVQDAKYIEQLILQDLVNTIQSYQLSYDYLTDMIKSARHQQSEKYKKDRKDFHALEGFLIRDFFGGDKRFKLTSIVAGGWEDYYYSFRFTCEANEGEAIPKCSIQIPIKKRLTVDNIAAAAWGQLEFLIQESEYCHCVKHKCYDIEGIAAYIKDYFNLKVEDEK